jgi:putative endonuclease
MNNRKTGALHEEKASRWLTMQGAEIITRNFRCRFGEIDMIANHQEYLVFIEVKYRNNVAAGYPVEAVNLAKKKNICKVADYYRSINRISDNHPIRYDIIGICGQEITWYQNAFDHIRRGH